MVRDSFFDLLKSWAIYLVVLQHMMACMGDGLGMWDTPVGKIITMFNMPLFMFIVGYFSKSSLTRSFSSNVKQKWVTLVRPMLPFCFILLIISVLQMGGVNSTFAILKKIYSALVYSYWFILAVVISVFWTYAVFRFFPRLKFLHCIVASLITFMLLPKQPLYNISTVQALYPFFLLGLVSREYKLVDKIKETSWCLITMSVIVFAISYYYYQNTLFFYNFANLPIGKVVLGYLLLIPSGTCGIILSIVLIRILSIKKHFLIERLALIGQYTFLLYMEQQVIVNIISCLDLRIHSFIVQFLASLLVFIFLSLSIKPIYRNPKIRLYLMGKTA